MFIKSTEQSTDKTLVSLALTPLCCCLCCCLFWAAPWSVQSSARAAEPDYLAYPAVYPDNYILSQLFYSAFHMDDLLPMQRIVEQGMRDRPEEFPRFMALTLELAKQPDARLFMLLAPLAPSVADQNIPADLGSVLELTELLSGKGAAPRGPSLRDRIIFYEDEAKQVRPRGPQPEESLALSRNEGENPHNELVWTKNQPGGPRLVSTASAAPLPDGTLWGGVQTGVEDADSGEANAERTAYFSVSGGIIAFADPKGISEADFYADQTARPHLIEGPGAEGAAQRPCAMRLEVRAGRLSFPPELTVRLAQSNAGPSSGQEGSDFLCRAQCVLSYAWDGQVYSLSGKACTQSGWGVWPYSDELFSEFGTGRKP